MNRLKTGDLVVIRTGKDRNKVGKILSLIKDRAVVEGVNLKTHFNKPNNMMPGSIEKKEAAIHVSNIGLLDSKSKEVDRVPSLKGFSVKVGYRIENGKKIRFNKKTGSSI